MAANQKQTNPEVPPVSLLTQMRANNILIEPGEIIDVLLMISPYSEAGNLHSRPLDFFGEPVRIANDIWLGDIGKQLSNAIIDACEPKGDNSNPTPKPNAPYAFMRRNAPAHEQSLQHDPDGALTKCVMLSRLVHPTSIGFKYAARITTDQDGKRRIIPSNYINHNPHAFVIDPKQNWLTPADVPAISRVMSAYDHQTVALRIKSALWYHETAARNYYMEIRWPLLITGIEALVHIAGEMNPKNPRRYAGSTHVFVDRMLAIGRIESALSISEDDLRAIYDRRSSLTHGQSYASLKTEDKKLYSLTENSLRNILLKAIVDTRFGSIFAAENALKNELRLR